MCVAKRFLARAPSTLRGSAIRGLTVTHTTPVHTTPLTPPNTHFVRTFSDNAAEDVAAPTEEASPKVQALCDQLCELNVIEMNQLVNLFKVPPVHHVWPLVARCRGGGGVHSLPGARGCSMCTRPYAMRITVHGPFP